MQLMSKLACTLPQHELQDTIARVLATLDQTPRAVQVCASSLALFSGFAILGLLAELGKPPPSPMSRVLEGAWQAKKDQGNMTGHQLRAP